MIDVGELRPLFDPGPYIAANYASNEQQTSKNIPPWSLLPSCLRVPALPEFLPCLPSMMGKLWAVIRTCKSNKSLPPEVTYDLGVFHSRRRKTKIMLIDCIS